MKLNRIILIPATCLAFTIGMTSCGEDNDVQWWDWSTPQEDPETPEEPEEETPEVDPNEAIAALGWINETVTLEASCGEIPDYIQIYKAPATLQEKDVFAYIAVADMSQATFNVLGDAENLYTPSAQYEASSAPVLVNGGYFYLSSLSLIMREGQLICPNNQVDSPDWTTTYYYPPRGTFAMQKDGSVEVSWVYTLLSGVSYSYPTAMPLEADRIPNASYPEGATEFKAETAIGGGPVLTRGGEILNTWEDEYLNVNPTDNRPRTAIGYIPETKRIVLFACAGDGIESVSGLTLDDVANVMLNIGCTESINLDGGGSTVMLINGTEIVKPSNGKQRSVGSCAAIM